MAITRREFIKKSGVLAGAGVIGAAIVPVAAKAAKGKVQTPSMAENWARFPDHIKVQLTEANLTHYEITTAYPPGGLNHGTATLEFAWTEYHRMEPLG